MKKILVPTDFSVNSKGGIRFAIQWATQQKLELVFMHVLHILRPTQWSEDYFNEYAAREEKICRVKFETFIAGIYRSMNVKPGKHYFLISQGFSPDITILDYCRKNPDINYICISTRGAGSFKKILGTNTGNLITKSPVPVLAIPKNYKTTSIRNILYAADFRNYSEELKKVIAFALPLKTKVDVLHFVWPEEYELDEKKIESDLKKKYKYELTVHIEKNDVIHTFIQNLENQIRKRKPSIVVMFTNQKRTFFEKLFQSSKAEALSFEIKTPLLVFNKS